VEGSDGNAEGATMRFGQRRRLRNLLIEYLEREARVNKILDEPSGATAKIDWEDKGQEVDDASPYPHGSVFRYRKGCRCRRCVKGNADNEKAKAYYRDHNGKTPQGQTWQHGTENGYNHHKCRCEPCKQAHQAKGQAYKRRLAENARARARYREKMADPEIAAREKARWAEARRRRLGATL
jgi:hypothetical protein